MEGIGASKLRRSAEGCTVVSSSMWAKKPLASNVKLPWSKEIPLPPWSGFVAFPDTEPCNMSIVPVTVQFLHCTLYP